MMIRFSIDSYYKEKEELKNTINTKILDSIIDDNEEEFTQLILQIKGDDSNPNKEFSITNYKLPELLSDQPTFASLCSFFSAEKCFTSLSMLCPNGPSSDDFKKTDKKKRSPIHFACFGGNMNIIRQLYQNGFDLEAFDDDLLQPCHYSAMSGNLDVFKYLLTKGAVDLVHVYRTTPLSIACLYGQINIVKFFYENSDLNQKFCSVQEVNYKNNKTSQFHLACEGGHDDVLNYILYKNIEFARKKIKKTDYLQRTSMNVACQNGNLSCVKILANFENFNFYSESGKKHVSLIDAVEGGFSDVVTFLLKQKTVDINMKNSNSLTALNVAIIKSRFEIVDILIQNGATKNFKDTDYGDLFLTACGSYNIEIIKFLDEKFEIPYQTMGKIFMKQACKIEYEDLILFLIEKKCDLNCVNANDFNYRIRWNKFMTFLQKNGLDFTDMKLADGTPIIINAITSGGSLNSVKDLISHGVALNGDIIDKYELVNLACNRGDLELFTFLMKFKPTMKETDKYMSTLTGCMHDIKHKHYTDYDNGIEKCIQIAEILLRDYNANPNDQGVLVFMACHLFLNALEVFEKYGADFHNIVFLCPNMISNEFIPLIDFLRERNIEIDQIQTNYKTSLIIECFRHDNSALADKLLFEGATLTKEMIEKYKLVKIACENGNSDLINILISYEPDIDNPTLYLTKIIRRMSKQHYYDKKVNKNELAKAAEVLIRDYGADCNDEIIINYSAQECLFEILDILIKCGADFTNCKLDYEKMVTKDHFDVFLLLEKNGCKFKEHKKLNDIDCWPKWESGLFNKNDDSDLSPIKVHVKHMIWHEKYDINTLIFLIKYSSDEELISIETNNVYMKYGESLVYSGQKGSQNIVDILLLYDQYQAILDLYQRLNDILWPLYFPKDKIIEMINRSDIQELKDMISSLSLEN